jgi:MoaA/NifB/PqqE/SkfB family radical SAM enzyme
VQISLDGATEAVYRAQRVNGSLAKAVDACRRTVAAGLPLEVTFAPTKLNIHEIEAAIDLAASLGAFRFNTGQLMRLGTAAKLWGRLEPSMSEYERFLKTLERKERELAGRLELCFSPFSLAEEMSHRAVQPSGTLLILPDGRVKVAAPLPFVCADLKSSNFLQAWEAYKAAWSHPAVRRGLERLAADPAYASEANRWVPLESASDLPVVV